MFDFGNPYANRCRHNVVDYNWITDRFAEIYCKRCGEKMGSVEDLERKEDLVTGKPRELTNSEKQMLR